MKNLKFKNITQLAIAIIVTLCSFSTTPTGTALQGSCTNLQAATTIVEAVSPVKKSNINRAKDAFLKGPTIKGVKVMNHKFNFWKTVKVTKQGKNKIVTGRFSYDRKWKSNHKYYFSAKFDSKGKLIELRRSIQHNASLKNLVKPYVKFVSNDLLGRLPYVGGKIKIKESDINSLYSKSFERVKKAKKGKVSWKDAADEIACILAIAAANK